MWEEWNTCMLDGSNLYVTLQLSILHQGLPARTAEKTQRKAKPSYRINHLKLLQVYGDLFSHGTVKQVTQKFQPEYLEDGISIN